MDVGGKNEVKGDIRDVEQDVGEGPAGIEWYSAVGKEPQR